MRTLSQFMLAFSLGLSLIPAVRAADQGAADAPRIAGSLTFTCVPDPKSKAAGAKEFEDTLELGDDRVTSKALSADGFPVALSIPKIVNGVPTFNIVFKKPGTTATYFIRAKPGGDVTGSFTRVEGGKTLRYAIGGGGGGGGAKQVGNTSPSLDPEVLRVNGGFVRLMSVQVAMADAGVNADKAKLAAILKSAGNDHNALRGELAQRKLDAKQYVSKAEARLTEAQRSVTAFLGANAAAVEAAQDGPFAGTYVYLNQMRGAVADSVGGEAGARRADQLIYQSLVELTNLARTKDKLTPDVAAKLRERTKADVTSAVAEPHRERFEFTLDAMASYKPGGSAATTRDAKAK
jgi:hypothetical protein